MEPPSISRRSITTPEMFQLALSNLRRRPVRNGLAVAGLAAAVSVLALLSAFGSGYQHALSSELNRMGMHLMLVPLGCPYDAAARVLKGNTLENSLPGSVLAAARRDPAVAIAAPLLIASVPRPQEGRADLWVGLDETARELKPWWRVKAGTNWFPDPDSAILGSEAAEVEMRAPGDQLFSPETGQGFRVVGVLDRSGTSDDSLFFIPLPTAQRMFQQPGRLTAVAIRLRDPALLGEASRRLQRIPGAQVVTLTEMMGTFLNLVGSVRTLSRAVAFIALTVSALGVLNTLLATVVERANELALLRALGASRRQVFGLLATESLFLTSLGSGLGLALVAGLGWMLEEAVKRFVPFAPRESILMLTPQTAVESLLLGLGIGLLASLYPAWRASRAQPAQALRED
jgi:putative ABC transport system permease protein